jgi:endogenous inhibitor of DNA gyrase (YacG/DUF329 family)
MDDGAARGGMSGEPPVRLKPRRPCPVCGKPAHQKFFPFCSARCANIDLNRWLGGNYAIPAEDIDETSQETENPGSGTDGGQ